MYLYGKIGKFLFSHNSHYRTNVFEQHRHRGLVAVDEGIE